MSQSRWKNVAGRMRLYSDWPKVVFPLNRFLHYAGVNPTLHVRRGPALKARIFSDDLPIINEIFAQDSYGIRALSLGPSPVVVDIGGNIGAFCSAIRHRFPEAKLVAYEPHPENFALLKANCPYASLEQKAIAGSAGQVHIEASGHASALRLAKTGIAVPAITLEDALAPFDTVDLLKVDIEGSEYDVFTHTPAPVLGKVKQVIVEVHKDEWRGWFEQFFRKCGFAVRWDKDLLIAKK